MNSALRVRRLFDFPRPVNVELPAGCAFAGGELRKCVEGYCRWGFVHPATNPEYEGWYFDSDAIGAIRWAEYLRVNRGVNLSGVRVIFQLVEDLGRKRPANW